MKQQLLLVLPIVLFACGQSNTNQESKETEVVNHEIEKEPLSYDELETRFKDSTVYSEDQKNKLYALIFPNGTKMKDGVYELPLPELIDSYIRLRELTSVYQDSGNASLIYLDNALRDLDIRTDALNNEAPIDINLKLKISEIKSDIYQNLNNIRLKSVSK